MDEGTVVPEPGGYFPDSPALVSRAMDEVMVVPEAGVRKEWGMVQWQGKTVLALGLGQVPVMAGRGLR